VPSQASSRTKQREFEATETRAYFGIFVFYFFSWTTETTIKYLLRGLQVFFLIFTNKYFPLDILR